MQKVYRKNDSLTKAEKRLKRHRLIIKNKIRKDSQIKIEGFDHKITFISDKSYYLFAEDKMFDPLDIFE